MSNYLSIEELLTKKESLTGYYVTVKGFLVVSKLFSYLISNIDMEFQAIIQPSILIPEKKICESIEQKISPRVGGQTMVMFWGEAFIKGILFNTGFSMFPIGIKLVSDLSFRNENQGVLMEIKYYDPIQDIFIEGITHLSPTQIKEIKFIIGGTENFLQLRERLTDGGKHLIAEDVKTKDGELIIQKLKNVGINAFSSMKQFF